MEYSNEIIVESGNGVGWIKLNRPKALNALSWDMVHHINAQLKAWKDDATITLVCITSTLEKAFCAGGDVKAVYTHLQQGDRDYPTNYLSREYVMDYTVHTYPKPILVYMNGMVMGGGVGLSIGSKYRIVTEKTKWAMPEVQIGFFPDVAASYFLNKLPGSIGRYLGLTASIIDGVDLMYLKAADYYLQSNRWERLEEEIKTKIWEPDTCDETMTNLLTKHCTQEVGIATISNLEETINNHFSHHTMEEIIASLKKDAQDPFVQKMINTIDLFPPTSLKATLELLIRGEELSLLDCFKMELDLAMNIIETHNFKEGIRSVLVDKDRQFNWNPKEFEKVSDQQVAAYFTYDWNGTHPIDRIRNDKD